MNQFLFEKHARATRIIALLLCILMVGFAGYKLYFPTKKEIVVTYNGEEVYRQSLFENVSLLIRDGAVSKLEADASVDLNTDAQINVFELNNGVLRCAASNCSDQQCVYSGEIEAVNANDMIVCYEHNLIVAVQ